MNDSKAWEVDTLRGHFNNVSCVLFHPKKDLILSNSEDRTIRVWDVTKRAGIHTFRRENDRFWILTAHRSSNLVAVGHDAGMVVFKLDCERPLAMSHSNNLYVVQDRDVHVIDLDKQLTGKQFAACRRASNAMTSGMKQLQFNPYNPSEINVLVYYTQDDGCYDLFVGPNNFGSDNHVSPRQGSAQAVAFTARNRFAVLQQSGSIGIYNLQNELSKKFDPPVATDYIFQGGNNRILLKSEDKIVMYDLTARKVVDEVTVPGGIRYCVWSQNGQYVAFMSKHNVLMAGKNLEYLHSFHENIRVKSGAWDENGVFIYSTLSHVKYCLPNGDSGIIHSLQNPIYIVRVHKHFLYYVDREHNVNKQRLNCSEYLFKLALHRRQFNDVKMWITNGRICGNAVIGYLKQKGFPEVALHFVEDQQTRFNLALEYGHIEEAMTAAEELNEAACWNRLGLESLRQGNQKTVEMVYQKTKNFDALSFLYLITGDIDKLKKMLKIAEMRNDVMSRFHNALMLGSIDERVKILAEMGQIPLAALTAKAHNLVEYIPKLEEQLEGNDVSAHIPADAKLLLPCTPLCRPKKGDPNNWPLLRSVKQIFEKTTFENVPLPAEPNFMDAMEDAEPEQEEKGMWGDDEDIGLGGDQPIGGADWGDMGDLDLGADIPDEPVPVVEQGANLTMGEGVEAKWLRQRKLPADLIAAGEFEEALGLLKRRLGLINAAPLEPLFKEAYWATRSTLPGPPQSASLLFPLLAEGNPKSREVTPLIRFNSKSIVDRVKEAQKLTTAGKFGDALAAFRAALQAIPLSVATDAQDEKVLTDMIECCREYINFCRVEVARKQLAPTDVGRNVELAAYMTACKVQSKTHQCLALQLAMFTSFKAQNFVTAASFARRIVQGAWGEQGNAIVPKARQVLAQAEKNATDAHSINFDPRGNVENLSVCQNSFKLIGPADPVAVCPYCGSKYHTHQKGKLCDTCQLAEVGANTLGIQLRPL